MTRTGYHGARVDGQETGRFEEALITVSSWLQGTSRDGDPQDHVHNQIARLVKTVRDGKYRALDTVCLRQVLGAVQAIVATHVECGLTREFGVQWVARTDGRGNEIEGITQEQMDAYSARTVAITERDARGGRVVDGQVRAGAEPAGAAVHPAGSHAGVASRQGRRRDRLGRADRAVGRADRRGACVGCAARVEPARGRRRKRRHAG